MGNSLRGKLMCFALGVAVLFSSCSPRSSSQETVKTVNEPQKWTYFCKDGYQIMSYTIPFGESSIYNPNNGKWYYMLKERDNIDPSIVRVSIESIDGDGNTEFNQTLAQEGYSFSMQFPSDPAVGIDVKGEDVVLMGINTTENSCMVDEFTY